MLPEWTEQWGMMLTWPHNGTDWASWLSDVERTYTAIAREVTRREKLLVVAQDDDHADHIRKLIAAGGGEVQRVVVAFAKANDTWARDHGPITVETGEGKRELLDFVFNGWGNKWVAEDDNAINRRLEEAGVFAVPMTHVDLVMEGGALETDGLGTVMTTRKCLLSPERNPQLDERAIEKELEQWLGAKRVLWLDNGHLEGDDTDSHIDTLARFADAETIVYQACDDESDSHFDELQAMKAELEAFRTVEGEPYRLHALPWPRAQHDPSTGQRLPATYANFTIINNAVLAPSYDDPSDMRARVVLNRAFPQHDIIMIDCRPIIRGFGSLHCITMQIPTGVMA
ncbi:MAG: agmatine deiminase family protein [Proteobacteria bacterium]|nr:agmatine deiminase family protein [Pseudomonadota bacterium]